MPARIKLALGVTLTVLGAAVVASTISAARFSALAAVVLVTGWTTLSLAVAFMFWPRFDPTGTTFWRGPTAAKRIALTFDDGPSAATTTILDILAARGIKASFFFLGERAATLPDVVRRTRNDGHAVGSHGYTHQKMHRMNGEEIRRTLADTENVLGKIATVRGRKMLRVPHGFKSPTVVRVARKVGYVLIAWTLGVWDSDCPGADEILRRIIAGIRPGCVLLLHDGDGACPEGDRSQTAEALMPIIDHCLHMGYQFVTVPEMFS